jgi:hypothetical protein
VVLLYSRSANYSAEEQAKITKKEKEEKKRKTSVFSRFGSSYRTKKVSTQGQGSMLYPVTTPLTHLQNISNPIK